MRNKFIPGENPIGKTLFLDLVQWEIVGIVGDVRSVQVAEAPGMEFYRPWAQNNFPFVNITVRSNLKVDAVTKLVQSALTKVNPGLAIAVPQTMDAVVAQALGQARLMMWLARNFRRRRLVARQHRNLRRRRLHCRATHRRNWSSHGARRANARRAPTCRKPGNETRCDRTRDRDYLRRLRSAG